VLAGIHGGYEGNTVALAEALIAHLTDHPQALPADLTLWIVPVVNVDGFARAQDSTGRANAHGVDINRNFPALWKADWPRAGCWAMGPITAGEAPGSEPETLAVMRFLLGQHVEALVSYHSAALGIYSGGQPPDPRSEDLAQVLAAASGYAYPPVDTGCAFTGQLIDWAAANGIAAVDVELTTHSGLDLAQNLALLEAFLAWTPMDAAPASDAR
jgi:protein MpaA